MKFTTRPSRRAVRNQLAFMGGATAMEQTVSSPRGKQPESRVNDAVREWGRLRGALFRNRRGMIDLPRGGKMPIGLGPNGAGDNIGWQTVTITPAMVGKRVAVYTEIESKTPAGRLAEHQQQRLEEVRDAGGIAFVATQAQDCEDGFNRWRERFTRDER